MSEVLAAALSASGGVDRATHGFHTYPAGLHPDAAAILVGAFGGDVLDPFCGGGTVLVEARCAGRRAVGRDVSPVALLVSQARCCTAGDEELTLLRSVARRATEVARRATEPPPDPIARAVAEWYAPHAAIELESLRRSVAEAPSGVRPLLRCCLSSILVKVSWRRSDTSGRRVKHRRPPGTTAVLFHKKARELARRIVALRGLVPAGTPEADLQLVDVRQLRLDTPVDLVITSPPYPSTYDYLPLQHLRRIWLELPDGRGEIGARRAWRQGERRARRAWRDDTFAWTARAAGCLREGGHLIVVIGDGVTPAGAVDTSEPTEEAARAAGLTLLGRASVERADHAREGARWEHTFAFRKERG
ncbi:MAG TPA: hypothetical protein ENK18_24805 [Deltaproteobacteria bacterium]|nr:hypothetical protein [Deltaproteobacteria bacterium]